MRNGIRRLAPVVLACALVGALPCAALAQASPDAAPATAAADVAAAQALLDDWGGDATKLASARQLLERVLRDAPASDAALRQLARLQSSEGYRAGDRYDPDAADAAVATAARAVAAAPGVPLNHLVHADMLVRAMRTDAAAAALDRASAPGGGAYYALVAGEVARARGDATAARRRFEAALAGKPDRVVARRARSRLIDMHVAKGELDAAERLYRAGLAAEPPDAWRLGNFAAFLLCDRDDADAALRTVREARALADYPLAAQVEAAAQARRWARAVAAGDAAAAAVVLREGGIAADGQPAARLFAACGDVPGVVRVLEAMRRSGVGERIPAMLAPVLAADSDSGAVPGLFSLLVQASGAPDANVYLNSERDYRDPRNLSINLTPRAQAEIRRRGDDPLTVYRGRRIEVAGIARKVRIDFLDAERRPTGKYYFQTHVAVDDIGQVTVIEATPAR